jgi:hypothetical protein
MKGGFMKGLAWYLLLSIGGPWRSMGGRLCRDTFRRANVQTRCRLWV